MSATTAETTATLDSRLFALLERDTGIPEADVRALPEFEVAVGGCRCGGGVTTARILVADWSGESDDLFERRVCGGCYVAVAWEE